MMPAIIFQRGGQYYMKKMKKQGSISGKHEIMDRPLMKQQLLRGEESNDAFSRCLKKITNLVQSYSNSRISFNCFQTTLSLPIELLSEQYAMMREEPQLFLRFQRV